MISNFIMILYSPFAILFGEKPSDDPDTRHLIKYLQSYDNIDSIEIHEQPQTSLRKTEQLGRENPDLYILIEKSKPKIKTASKILINALIYPPDDISLCNDILGYLIFKRGASSDTIIVDDGAKVLRHKIGTETKSAYYEGEIWSKITSRKRSTNSCNEANK